MMAASDPRREGGTDIERTAREPGRPRVLSATRVSYEDRPDRRTVYPADTDDVARMSTWLTADADAFRDLGTMR
jgi:hypothetical protein